MTIVVSAVALLIVFCSLVRMDERFGGSPPSVAQAIDGLFEPLHIVSAYGLFAVMTTKRNEIVIEGSDDGSEWREYEFRYKPGDVARAPPWNIPHQPRLDWQMWFAALDDPRRLPWFSRFLERLLENEPTVTALLEKKSLSGQAADLCARAVLRLHLCRQRGKGEGPMVGPAIAGTVFPRGASESPGKPRELKRGPRSADILVVFRVR